jgi:hypothetical protein
MGKEGIVRWSAVIDPAGDVTHVMPDTSPRHVMFDCWCHPIASDSGSVVTHQHDDERIDA